jgi:aldehyde dehydrogenase (NAD+)
MTVAELCALQKSETSRGRMADPRFRRAFLKNLKDIIRELEDEIYGALAEDLGKCAFETYSTELAMTYHELDLMAKKCVSWSKPKTGALEFFHWPSKGFVQNQAYGSVLVFAPWNYPFLLSMMPCIGALAAGNTVVLKPSEYAPATAQVLQKIADLVFMPSVFSVVNGDYSVGQDLLAQKWDYLFATGGEAMGKIVAQACARTLTPLTLELGGKSPCIVTEKSDLKIAAKRIAWGKFVNAGQTCVAPDYILIPKSIKEKFCLHLKDCIREFYGEDPKLSPDFARIINSRHFARLSGYLKDGHVFCGGMTDESQKYISPTIMTDCNLDSPVMSEEIFGPILPVVECESFSSAIDFVNARPRPLALYLFSKDKKERDLLLRSTHSGGVGINETIMQCASSGLPFGGVGASGMGQYHGRNSFETFSQKRSVVVKPAGFDLPIRYAPYGKKLSLVKKVM